MPQFKPFWWVNLLSWLYVIFISVTAYHNSISFPATIRNLIARICIVFK